MTSSYICFRKIFQLNIRGKEPVMNILNWIDKTIENNKEHPNFIYYLQMIKEHYMRNFSEDPRIRETAIPLEQLKNIILSIFSRHKEFNIDIQSLQKATEAFFDKD